MFEPAEDKIYRHPTFYDIPDGDHAHLMASLTPAIPPGTGRGTMRSWWRAPAGATGAGAFDAPVEDAGRSALFDYVLRLGDDSLILGQRLGEWCGHAPTRRGRSQPRQHGARPDRPGDPFPALAGEVEGQGRDGDALAFHRDVLDFRNCLLVEQPNGDFAQTMARQFLFSTWQEMLFGASDRARRTRLIAAIAAKAVKEVTYHASCRRRMGDPPRRRHRREPRRG